MGSLQRIACSPSRSDSALCSGQVTILGEIGRELSHLLPSPLQQRWNPLSQRHVPKFGDNLVSASGLCLP